MYGRGWKTSATTIGAAGSGASSKGLYTGEAGILSYYEVGTNLNIFAYTNIGFYYSSNSFESTIFLICVA